jgi:hypothetical protein
MGCPWVGQNVSKEEQNGRSIEIYPQTLFAQNLSFLSDCKSTWYTLLIFGSYLEINMFIRLGQVFFYIVAYHRRRVRSSYGLTEH